MSSKSPKIQLIPVASQEPNWRPSPILHTDIFVFVERHIPENSDIQQHAWESHRSPSECWHEVAEKPSTRILLVPSCTCVQRSVSSHHPVSWLHYGTRLGVSLLTQGGREAMSATDSPRTDWRSGMKLRACVRSWVAVRKFRARGDWDKSCYIVP